MHRSESGYALLGVLVICVGLAGLAFSISTAARGAMATSRNRIALTEASWTAAACLAHARAMIAETLQGEPRSASGRAPGPWHRLDRTIGEAPALIDLPCTLSARAVGSRLDVNASDEGTLRRLLREVMPGATADSAAAALADWMDRDDAARPLGVETAWYEAHVRPVPANAPFIDMEQVHLVRGLERVAGLDSLLGLEPGPIALNHAPPQVLALLHGFTPETVARVLAARRRELPIRSFRELADGLSPSAAEALDAAAATLPGLAVLEPVAWVLAARSRRGTPPVTAVVELRLTRAGERTVVERRRSWIE